MHRILHYLRSSFSDSYGSQWKKTNPNSRILFGFSSGAKDSLPPRYSFIPLCISSSLASAAQWVDSILVLELDQVPPFPLFVTRLKVGLSKDMDAKYALYLQPEYNLALQEQPW